MKKSNIILFVLVGLMLLSGCKASDQDVNIADGKTNENVQATGQKKNDFSVITVGTGTPKFSDIKAKASTMIQYKGTYYLVDCGDGSNINLLESDFDFKNLDSIFFTHHHLDHTSDFFDIYAQRFLRNDEPIDIIGPPRTSEFVEFFNDIFLDDLLYRKLELKNVDDSYKEVIENYGNVIELGGANNFELDELNVTCAKMTHTMYDLAYKFEVDGKSIVISGDTSYNENLVILAKDADILVIDGTLYTPKLEEESASSNIDPFFENGGDFDVEAHLSFEEMIAVAVETNVKTLVVTHFNEATQEKIDLSIAKIKESFDGQVIYATDMLEIGINTDK